MKTKKPYIAPTAEHIHLYPEGMLAQSGEQKTLEMDNNGSLDSGSDMRSHRRTIWNSGSDEKGWLK